MLTNAPQPSQRAEEIKLWLTQSLVIVSIRIKAPSNANLEANVAQTRSLKLFHVLWQLRDRQPDWAERRSNPLLFLKRSSTFEKQRHPHVLALLRVIPVSLFRYSNLAIEINLRLKQIKWNKC